MTFCLVQMRGQVFDYPSLVSISCGFYWAYYVFFVMYISVSRFRDVYFLFDSELEVGLDNVLLGDDEVLHEELVDGVVLLRLFLSTFLCLDLPRSFLLRVGSLLLPQLAVQSRFQFWRQQPSFQDFHLPLMIYSLYSSPLLALADLQRDLKMLVFQDYSDLLLLLFFFFVFFFALLHELLCSTFTSGFPLLTFCCLLGISSSITGYRVDSSEVVPFTLSCCNVDILLKVAESWISGSQMLCTRTLGLNVKLPGYFMK